MSARVTTLGMALLAVSACGIADPAGSILAGRYDLVAVNGSNLPCCADVDSIGTRITFIGGSLALGEGAPEAFVATPAGWMPKSCVYGIPNGARVDTSGVVTLPDGGQYRIPKCTEVHHAPYTMTVTRRYDYTGDSSQTLSATSSGTYAWSAGEGDQSGLIALLNGNLIGPVTTSAGAVELTVGRANVGRGPARTPVDPEYRFLRAPQ